MNDIILNINNKEFKAEFDPDDYRIIRINGKSFEIELLKKFGNNLFTFAVNQQLKQAELAIDNNKKVEIIYDGMVFEVDVKDSTQKLLEKYIQNSSHGASNGLSNLKAPMPGLLVKYFVHVGDFVNKGDKLCALEAMKMENIIKSNISGTVRKLNIKEGTPIEKNAIIMEFDIND